MQRKFPQTIKKRASSTVERKEVIFLAIASSHLDNIILPGLHNPAWIAERPENFFRLWTR